MFDACFRFPVACCKAVPDRLSDDIDMLYNIALDIAYAANFISQIEGPQEERRRLIYCLASASDASGSTASAGDRRPRRPPAAGRRRSSVGGAAGGGGGCDASVMRSDAFSILFYTRGQSLSSRS